MNNARWTAGYVVVGALGMVASLGVGACKHYTCNESHECGYGGGDTTTSTSTSTSTSSGGGGAGGSGGGAICDPTMGVVDDTCGVFVSSSKGADKNAGTKDAPFHTLAAALAAPKVSVVYACSEEFPEAVTISNGVTIYGGLDCTQFDWPYVGKTKKTSIKAPLDSVATLIVKSSATDSTLRDLHIESVKPSMPGASSIGVIVDQAKVDFEDCEIVAGDGADGAPGAAQMQVAPGANGKDGVDGACKDAIEAGGVGGSGMCAGDVVDGANGGSGQTGQSGGPGLDGFPKNVGIAPDDGKGGVGQDQQASTACKTGHVGAPGTPGQSGTGATGVGTLTSAGYQAPASSPGLGPGTHGQGGGGGGGAAQCGNMKAGPSGGGGGAGGCGGGPGNAGGSAGSSLGLVSLMATVTLKHTPVVTGLGGKGGLGGDGQPGAAGGLAGNAVAANACGGGQGGQGGRGGSGGGGLGGHSVAIAIQGGTAPVLMSSTLMHSTPGLGAAGGNADMAAKGEDGLGCSTLDFTDAMSCK